MAKAQSQANRLIWADVTRIIAIVLVVLVHTFPYPTTTTWSAQVSLYIFICAKTCVPLFLMLTGALLLSKQEPTTVFFLKRVRRIIAPWLTWALVIFLITNRQLLTSPLMAAHSYFGILSSSFTYLPMIICLYLLIPTFRIVVREVTLSHVWFLIALWFIATSLLPFSRNTMAFPLSVDNGLVRQTIQYSGYLFLGWALQRVVIKGKWLLLVLLGTLLTALWSMQLVLGETALQFQYLTYSAPLIIISSAGFFVVLANCESYSGRLPLQVKKAILVLSEVCFGVFLSHPLIVSWLNSSFFTTSTFSLSGNIFRWLISVAVSFAFIILLSRIKPLKKWIT